MKINVCAIIFATWTVCQAVPLSLVATTSLTLFSLSTPVCGFFGIFRRRKSPVQETNIKPEQQSIGGFGQPFGGFNPFNSFGGNGMFFPGMNPGLGVGFGQRFPPQFQQPQQMNAVPQTNRIPQMPPQMPPPLPPQQFPPQQFPSQQFPPQFPPQQFSPSMAQNMPPMMPEDMDGFPDSNEEAPGMNTEEAESFFTLLAETDESKCISRLVCEMGANPESGGEFGQTIVDIIGSLKDFPDGSKVSEYNEILSVGLTQGLSACASKFSSCDDESFDLVKQAQVDNQNSE